MKVLLADDHALFRDSLRCLLEAHDVEVVGEAASGAEALALAAEKRPDLVLMDLDMPGMDGLDATRQMRATLPNVKVVVLTGSADDHDLFATLREGAHGYLLKTMAADGLVDALAATLRGERQFPKAYRRRGSGELSDAKRLHTVDALTNRELDVLRLLATGVTSNRELARELEVSENTVKFHVRNILDKLQLKDRAQAVGYALRHRLVRLQPDSSAPALLPRSRRWSDGGSVAAMSSAP